MQSKSKRLTTRQLTTIAILAAISAVLFMVEIPVVLFYKLDFSNLPLIMPVCSNPRSLRKNTLLSC